MNNILHSSHPRPSLLFELFISMLLTAVVNNLSITTKKVVWQIILIGNVFNVSNLTNQLLLMFFLLLVEFINIHLDHEEVFKFHQNY